MTLIDECKAWKNISDEDNPDETHQVLKVFTMNGSDSNCLKCKNGVFDIDANIPYIITESELNSICSHEFFNSNNNKIYLSVTIILNQITVCSRTSLQNVLYKIIGA